MSETSPAHNDVLTKYCFPSPVKLGQSVIILTPHSRYDRHHSQSGFLKHKNKHEMQCNQLCLMTR